jgi:DNA-binding NtrC family response regulator
MSPPAAERHASSTGAELPRGDETVLLVDDDEQVRRAIGLLLKNLGYRALIAADAQEALTLLDDHERVDLMVTDIVMPGMDGVQLGERVHTRRPELPVVFISGYTDRAVPELAHSCFLRKPFAMHELAHVVRDSLDGRNADA